MSEYIFKCEYDTFNGTFSQKRGEEIVRCRDCKRFSGYELEPHFGYCERYDLQEVRGNGFCAWGERRDA